MRVSLPAEVRNILTTVGGAGHQIYIVGGASRDLLMRKKIYDWDFTTSAKPEVVTSLFEHSFYDNRYGTVGIIDPESKKINSLGRPQVCEVTTFRREWGYSDGRHPDEVAWGKTLEEDLVRRDFTINAIAFKPAPEKQPPTKRVWSFDVIDPHDGQKDLERKLIRAVGRAEERFGEDALRMLRAVRLATQLNFTIEEKTLTAIKNNTGLLANVSWERIRDELLKMLIQDGAAEGYLTLRKTGLAEVILPEVERGFGIEQKSPGRHHIYDVGTHSVLSLKFCRSKDPVVRLAALIHDIGKPVTFQKSNEGLITFYNHEMAGAQLARVIAARLRLRKSEVNRLVSLVRWHQFSVDERQTDKAIRRFIKNVGREYLEDILAVRTADRLGGGAQETSWRLENFKRKLVEVQKQPFTVADLKVDGHEVMWILRIKPGPMVGEILSRLFEEVEEDMSKNKKSYLRERIKSFSAGGE